MALPGSTDLCAIPAAESPDGTHNFVNPESLGAAVIAVGVVLATISTVFGAGRLYANRNSLHSADCKSRIAHTKQTQQANPDAAMLQTLRSSPW